MLFEQTLSDLDQGIKARLAPKLWRELEVVTLGNEVGTVLVPAALRQAKHEVYCTFVTGDVGKVINTQVANRDGLEVWIGLPPTPDENRLHVKEVFVRPAMDDLPPSTALPAHARDHSLSEYPINGDDPIYAATDPLWVDARQLMSLGIFPSGGLTIIVTGGFISFGDTLLWYDGGSLDITSSVPGAASKVNYISIEVDRDLVLSAHDGTAFDDTILTGLSSQLVEGAIGKHQVGYVRLATAQTDIDYSDIWSQTGLHSAPVFPYEHDDTEARDYTVEAGRNAIVAGPFTISGTWTISGRLVVI